MTGWTGTDCSIPICVQGFYDPLCKGSHAMGGEGCYRCPNEGVCIAPDTCRCKEGWTGYDCRTPICTAVVDNVVRRQLMTVDVDKLHAFEKDPCGMKGLYKPENFNGAEHYRGNCTLPNQCTCLCKSSYHEQLCKEEGGIFCITPFQDRLRKFRNILAPNEMFGTRRCNSGYEGIVDKKDNFMSCHMTIFQPSYMIKNTLSILIWGSLSFITLTILLIHRVRKKRKNYFLAKVERRKSKRASSVIPESNAFYYNDISKEM